jgi:cell division protease FtsH
VHPSTENAVEEIPFAEALECARVELFATGSAFAPATADEIAGLDDVVARVDELVRWLADADRFAEHGARLEPGVLFEGPPGTGKTLLARYLATASGARFVDVRDFPCHDELGEADVAALFRHARETRSRESCPVVLFWDELDELCPGPFGPLARTRARAVSALLAELDGVRGKARGVLLVACSNQPDELDAALLRPGRLGLRIELRPPDPAGQRLLLGHQVGRYPGGDAVGLDELVPFLAPEDTAAAIEEAVASAWRASVTRALDTGAVAHLAQADLRLALADRLLGAPPSFLRLGGDQRFRVAVHEVGHALAALAFAGGLRLVTVRPGRTTFGTTLTEPFPAAATLDGLFAELRIGLGGLAAEQVANVPRGTGCAGDTLRVSELALRAVELFAAGRRCGAFNPDATARRRGHRDPELSDALLARADLDAEELVAQALADVERVLRDVGRQPILALAEVLAERETMTGAELAAEALRLGAAPTRRAGRRTRIRRMLRR